MLTTVLAALLIGVAPSAHAQSPRPQFEVASIKHSGATAGAEFGVFPGGRLAAKNQSVWALIFHAYDLRPYQLPDSPEWTNSERYDIEAKAEGNPTIKEMMPMLQSLLQDRFDLKVHWGTKEQPVFLITPARGGIKLKSSTAKCVRFARWRSW
jgi:uncharacterized protein (TIGR03435 family)